MKCRLTVVFLVLVTLLTAPAWATTYPVADTFSGSGALSSNWTNTTAGASLSFKPVPLVQASGKVVPGASSPPATYPWGLAIYTAVSFTANQYSQVKFVAHSTAGSTTGPCVQMSLSGGGYCWEVDNLHINGFSNGASAGSIGITCPAVASGDTVKLSVAGTTLTCLDVTTGLSASGPGLTGFPAAGNPAVMVDTRNSSVYALSSFQADCAPSCNGGPAPAAIPTFSPGAGTYGSAQTVTISDTTSGASIYYTTNGTAPLTHVTSYTHLYSGPIAVTTSQVVQAIATATGDATSGTGSAVYAISTTVATPTFSPVAGTYTSPQTVTISDATTGATIYYTTDGSTPTTSSTVYSSPIAVSVSETVKALGVLSGYANSAIGSAAYVISGATVATPTFSPGAGSYSTPQTVTISDATSGATIYYTTDGSTPTTGSPVYASPIAVSVSETVKALGVKSGYTNSTIGSAAYTITGKTLTSIAISPLGGVLQPGSTLSFTVQCNYSDSSHDTCAAAGGATWSVSRPTVSSINSSGVFTESTPPAWQASHAYALGALVTDTNGYIEQAAVAGTSGASITWPVPGGTDSEGGAFVENNYWNDRDHSGCPPCGFLDGGVSWNLIGTTADQSYAVVTAAGLSDKADVYRQISGDTWYEYPTPDFHNYKDIVKNQYLPLNVAVGSKVTMGVGFVINSPNTGRGQPLQASCNWTSSDPSVATVDRHGQVTGVSPGSVTLTCGRAGNGNFSTTSNAGGWVSPGDTVALTVVDGGTGSTTWYVRPDGGTLYSSTNTSGQCSGKTDAPYPGSGTNGNCASGNIRYLWADGNTTYQMKWVINGGDTVIVAQNPLGYNTGLDYYPGTWSPVNCRGTEGGCNMPTIPSGTASQHTKILGKNYASCHADSAKTRLNVSWGAGTAFDVRDSQFVDIACFEITDEAACSTNSLVTNTCHNSTTLNWGRDGIVESALTSYVNYTDLFIHGLAEDGIHGPTGVGVVANYVHIRGVPDGGINMDDIPWGNGNISVAGGFTMTNSTTEFTGCVEEYSVTHNYPYIECQDQTSVNGGYGDGFGTASTTGDWYFDHDIWQYNYQDGLDLAHSGMQNLTVTNSFSHGNEGASFKIGSADGVIFQNNIAMANCFRLGELIDDEPSSALTPGGGPPGLGYGLCRANQNMSFHFTNLGTFAVQDNTIVSTSGADTPIGLACETGWDSCHNANAIFQNNLEMGYTDALNSNSDGEEPALFYLQTPDLQNQSNFTSTNMPQYNGWSPRNHNLFYNVRSGWCPTPLQTGETCDTADPLFVGEPASPISAESNLDNFNFTPTSSSVIGKGVAVPGITTDYNGTTRANPPSIGAIE